MAAMGSNVTEGGWKLKICLAIGGSLAIGLAVWQYRKARSRKQKLQTDESEKEDGVKEVKEEKKPLDKAQSSKNKGNKYFKAGKYDHAIKCYTEAIEICPPEHSQELATFHQNRAAAHEQLKKYADVKSDCTKALDYNKTYTKALFRRAKVCEITGDLTQCLEDVTAVCILENFQNQHSLMMADRALKSLGGSKAKEAYTTRKPVEPSPQFIRTYFAAFANDPIVGSLEKDDDNKQETELTPEGDTSICEKHQEESSEKEEILQTQDKEEEAEPKKPCAYQESLDGFLNRKYNAIVKLCSTEINLSKCCHLSEALLLRATFYLLRGEGNKAMEDLDKLVNIEDVDKRIFSNALIKRGSLKMQNGDQTEALDDFARAVREDPENSDIYHHRGQLNLLVNRIEEAVKDFEKSVTLSPKFAIAHVQKCYTDYRQAFAKRSPLQLQSAIKSFEDTLDSFPECAEGYALYGQALVDQQMYDKADENFKRALEIEKDNGNLYVHRGLLRLQWKQDLDEASRLIRKAVTVDDKCEFAYETLGTIEVQRGNMDEAMELFNKAINLAKTEVEMSHLFSLLEAAKAQSRVANNLGIKVPTMDGGINF